jgi:hypothetical protein
MMVSELSLGAAFRLQCVLYSVYRGLQGFSWYARVKGVACWIKVRGCFSGAPTVGSERERHV